MADFDPAPARRGLNSFSLSFHKCKSCVLPVYTWCHCGHVGGQEQKHFSPLGTKLYFHVNSSRKNSVVLTPNMAVLSRGCKPRMRERISINATNINNVIKRQQTPQTFFRLPLIKNFMRILGACGNSFLRWRCLTSCVAKFLRVSRKGSTKIRQFHFLQWLACSCGAATSYATSYAWIIFGLNCIYSFLF